MLNLNRKGFTLVELLAVVVVLSIAVGVAVPVTTNVITNSKYKTLMSVSDEAEEFIADQWKIKKMDPDTMDDAFSEKVNKLKENEFVSFTSADDGALIEAMGFDLGDIKTIKIMINDKGIPCVVITEIPKSSRLFNQKYWQPSEDDEEIFIPMTDGEKPNEGYYSKCCDPSVVQTEAQNG